MVNFGDAERFGMATNRNNWDSRVPVHLGPDGYRVELLANDPSALSDVVQFDRRYLGDLTGVDLVHLQCHLGTDTVSLARLGANITGLDFSGPAIQAARTLAKDCGIEARFERANLYDAVDVLGETYDFVYTGVGAINWLPDIGEWANVVAALLRPGGRFQITEGHPAAMIYSDEATLTDMKIEYPYFDGTPAIRWEESKSYQGSGEVTSPVTYEWAHHPASVIQALIDSGLVLDCFAEHRSLPWRLVPWMEDDEEIEGWYRLPNPLRDAIPLSFTVTAHKPAEN